MIKVSGDTYLDGVWGPDRKIGTLNSFYFHCMSAQL
jgi:hypothetical protein